VGNLLVLHALLPHRSSLQISQGALPRTFASNILDVLEADGRDEALALPRLADLAVELVDLLEGQALGLVDHEVDEGDADEAEAAPDEEDLGLQVGVAGAGVDHVRGGVGDGPVEQPVGCGGHGEGLGADLEREDLAGDDPGDGAPRRGEEENVDADESDQGALSDEVLNSNSRANTSHNKLADGHSDGTEEEKRATAPCFDKVQTREGRGDVHGRGDHRNGEGVGDAAALEERGAVVEDEVDTGELLKSLEETSSCETLAKVAAEAVEVAGRDSSRTRGWP
jgi:hypothetical protein